MRKTAGVLPFAALVLGAGGFFLRRVELKTAFEPSGFAIPGATVTVALVALTAAALIFAAITGLAVRARYQSAPLYERAYRSGGAALLAGCLAGLAFLIGTALYLYEAVSGGSAGIFDLVFAALAAISGFSLILLARAAFTGRFGGGLSYLSVFPALFFCLWLIAIYRENAPNPVILSYAYQITAACACAFVYYISAGCAFGKAYAGKMAFGHLAAVFFCAVALADPLPLWTKLFFGASLVFSLATGVSFFKNLSPKDA